MRLHERPIVLAELAVRAEITRYRLVGGSRKPQQLTDEGFGVSDERPAQPHGSPMRVTIWSMRVPSLSVTRILIGR